MIRYESSISISPICNFITKKKEGANAPQVPKNSIHITSDLVCYGVKGGIIMANKY
jgi:hypothetical protein